MFADIDEPILNFPVSRPLVQPVFFNFEEDFIENGIRCIPMIVRFKLDACGIKLKLSEWAKFSETEKAQLSSMDYSTKSDLLIYRNFLRSLVLNRTGNPATDLTVDPAPAWLVVHQLPAILTGKLSQFNWTISLRQWLALTNLQRFVLLKLCRPGHENVNFPFAVEEFGLLN